MIPVKRRANFIAGAWKAPSGGDYYINLNPADSVESLGEYPLSTAGDADEAVKAAAAAFPSWSALLPAQRAAYIEKFVSYLGKEAAEIGEAVCREEGKTLKEATAEPKRGVVECSYFASDAQRLEGITMPSDRAGVVSVANRVPIGVVVAISPWNFPFLTPLRKIIPAIAMGNTVVFKPAYDTPLSGVYLCELFEKAGLPAGVVNMVIGKGSSMGDALSSHPLVNGVTFTGSTGVGRRINRLASENFVKVQLEMGGKNPCIVADCADLDKAAAEITTAAFAVTGQRCTSISRVLVLREHAEELETKIAERMKSYVLGNGMDPKVTMGPVINAAAGESIMGYIEGAVADGARIRSGGHRLKGGDYEKGFYIEPTLIVDATPTMKSSIDEIFGPVLSVIKVDSFEEALAVANSSEYGLAASLFSDNLRHIDAFQRNIQSGMCHINHGTVTDATMPFGGVKRSGLGPFSKGVTNRDFFTNFKVTYTKYA